jgi:23S rRNA pseudouridine1911/1915/1917 synthase
LSYSKRTYGAQEYLVQHRVMDADEGERLDKFLMKFMGTLSREFIKNKIKKGDITIVGRQSPHRPNTKVHSGEMVHMLTTYKQAHEEEIWRGEEVKLQTIPEVIFDNAELIVINKPAFMSTHPTGRHLFNCATIAVKEIVQAPVYGVHRLDRETSGILIMGKTAKAAGDLGNSFEFKKAKKCYFLIAKLNGKPAPDFPFVAHERLHRTQALKGRLYTLHFPQDSTEGKNAKTAFELLHQEGDYVFALAFPLTGRQHQIRVHGMVHGLTLLGDKLYSGDRELFGRFKDGLATESDHELMEIPRQALHAMALKINQHMFISSFPKDLITWSKEKLNFDLNSLKEKTQEIIAAKFAENS